MDSSINFLELVYPPISNQEADWLWEDPEVRKYVSRSKLYMIGQREEIYFRNIKINEKDCVFIFDLVSRNNTVQNIMLPFDRYIQGHEIEIEAGEKFIRLKTASETNSEPTVLNWWTTDKLLFDFWRGNYPVFGLDDFRVFTNYILHYVGISKEGDSFSRLFANGHEKRTKILSNEGQICPNARLSDEIMLFLFDIDSLYFSIIDPATEEIDSEMLGRAANKNNIIADAEKAFINVLETKYNAMKYSRYPKSSDGLYGSSLKRWGFTINEPITLETTTIKMVFNNFRDDILKLNKNHSICVDKDKEEVILLEPD